MASKLKITSCLKWPLKLQPSHLLPRLVTWMGWGGRKRNYLSTESVYFKNPNQRILSISTWLPVASREARKVGKTGRIYSMGSCQKIDRVFKRFRAVTNDKCLLDIVQNCILVQPLLGEHNYQNLKQIKIFLPRFKK